MIRPKWTRGGMMRTASLLVRACLLAGLVMLLRPAAGAAETDTILTAPVSLPVTHSLDAPMPGPCCLPACTYAPRFWFDFESLAWWVKGAPLPTPLLTQGDLTGRGAL